MADLASTRIFGSLTVTKDVVFKGGLTADGSGITGTAPLRATGTTKADVGLNSVRNVSSYSQGESDNRYLKLTGGVVTGNLLLGGDGVYANQTASIALALGDSDTGLKWISDGRYQILANGIVVVDVTRDQFNVVRPLQQNGQQVYHAGNFNPATLVGKNEIIDMGFLP